MEATSRVLGANDYKDMPWKNGGGVTKELVRIPHPSGDATRFLARVSIATVASAGPFSTFAGIDRTLMIIEGDGVALTFAGPCTSEVVMDKLLRPLSFPGECGVQCRLVGGTVRDFNLMVDRSEAEVALFNVVNLKAGSAKTIGGGGGGVWISIVHVLKGSVKIDCGGGGGAKTSLLLAKDATLLEENVPSAARQLTASEDSVVVVMLLNRRN